MDNLFLNDEIRDLKNLNEKNIYFIDLKVSIDG